MSLHNVVGRYEIAAQEDRSAHRTRLSIAAQLRQSGGRPFQTVVNDLSLSGFSAAAVSRLHIGTMCWLTLPGLEALQAEVIWWEDSICGCAFAQLLNPIIHDDVLARHGGDRAYR
jgi:hypothetical protein